MNLRRGRQERGVSLTEMSRRAGIAKGTLSKLEAGEGNPTIDTLSALAVALQLPLGDLLADTTPEPTSVRRSEQMTGTSSQELLRRVPGGLATELWHLRLAAQTSLERAAHATGTVEHILCTEGTLQTGRTDDPVELQTGDSVTFAADHPHSYKATIGRAAATVLMIYPARITVSPKSRTP